MRHLACRALQDVFNLGGRVREMRRASDLAVDRASQRRRQAASGKGAAGQAGGQKEGGDGASRGREFVDAQ